MKFHAFIDRIEDNKIVVLNLFENKTVLYLPKEIFDFKIYEGLWVQIEILPDEEKTKELKFEVKKLQKELLERTKTKKDENSSKE